ncbi:NUDIX domain-containing protein [Streptococcus moroccensis]|uniref:8-oxo-dGTP diphosphatase n=1 Tax=Streptococcus moroccensis TaxID=1451356 RepID=A0ABT9YP63_9STRE|nr:NUDIX domain-containing protein [Streptococcus moroccensis]MDQ0221784.1 mutator protein MutT [Streptococcus moroccensis]
MTSTHFKLYAAVFPIIQNEQGQLLLHQRQNTGYMDGYWDLAGTGHIDPGETATEAVVRECQEELGIQVNADSLQLVHTVHRTGQEDQFPYIYLYFTVSRYSGKPKVMEAFKNAGLAWFNLEQLPDQMIEDRKIAIQKAMAGITYQEWRT